MGNPFAICVEEHEIAWAELILADCCAKLSLSGRSVRQIDAKLVEHIGSVAGAVKASGCCARPFIRRTQLFIYGLT